jgi:hypothetical protein
MTGSRSSTEKAYQEQPAVEMMPPGRRALPARRDRRRGAGAAWSARLGQRGERLEEAVVLVGVTRAHAHVPGQPERRAVAHQAALRQEDAPRGGGIADVDEKEARPCWAR